MRKSVTIASCILIAAACVAAASSTPKPPSPGQPPIAALVDAVLEFRQRPDKAAPRLDACALGRFVGGADPAPFLSPIRRSSLLGTWTKDCDPAYSPRPREDNVQFLVRTEGPDTTVRLPEGRGPSYRVTIEVRNSTEIYNEVFLLREFATTIGGTPRMRVYGYSWALDLSSDALAP
jgi:hypothetical protein